MPVSLRHGGLDDDVAAAEAVVVEGHAQRAVAHLGADVVDHLLTGPHAHALGLADVQPQVDRVAVVDARERGDIARLARARAVVADRAAGQDEGGESRGEEEKGAREDMAPR